MGTNNQKGRGRMIFFLLVFLIYTIKAQDIDNPQTNIDNKAAQGIIVSDVTLYSLAGTIGQRLSNFYQVEGIAVAPQLTDKDGYVIVSDNFIGTNIRRVDYNGDVTSIFTTTSGGYIDGNGTNAVFGHITGIAWDTNVPPATQGSPLEYDIYVCDAPNHVIRKISTDLIVTTVAGNYNISQVIDGTGTNAGFLTPSDICYSSYHNLYFIADYHIRSFDPISGNVTTVVKLPGQFEVEYISCGQDGTLFYSDSDSVIYKILNIGTPDVYTFPWLGATNEQACRDGQGGIARLSSPRSLCATPGGGLLITSQTCSGLRFADSTGLVTSLTGRGGVYTSFVASTYPGSFASVAGIASAATYDPYSQSIYIGDNYGLRVAFFSPPPVAAAPLVDISQLALTNQITVSWTLPTFLPLLTQVDVEVSLGSVGSTSTFSSFCTITNISATSSCVISGLDLDWRTADAPVANFRILWTNAYGATWGNITVVPISHVVIVHNVTGVDTTGGEIEVTVFDSDVINENSTVTILIGTQPCTNVVMHTTTTFTCAMVAGTGIYAVNVIVDGQNNVTFANYAFSYNDPVITAVFPSAPTYGGNMLTVVGQNFGPKNVNGSYDYVIVTITSSQGVAMSCTNVTVTVAHQMITCVTPPGTGSENNVYVIINNVNSKQFAGYAYQPPVITGFLGNKNISTDGTTVVTITGNNFGYDPSLVSVRFYKYGSALYGSLCTNLKIIVPHTTVACVAPAGTGVDNYLSFMVDNLSAPLPNFNISYAAPIITSSTTSLSSGSRITITGTNLGKNPALINVTAPSTKGLLVCTSVYIVVANTAISCIMPAGTGGARHLNVTVDTLTNTDSNTAFAYPPPFIYEYTAPSLDGGKLTLEVEALGNDPSVVQVSISKYYTNTSTICTNPSITFGGTGWGYLSCTAPPGSGYNNITITVNGQSGFILMQYPAPVVNYMSYIKPASTVTIQGQNFGSDASKITVSLSGTACDNIQVVSCYYSTYADCISCTTPDDVGSVWITVTVDSLVSYAQTTEYYSPSINSISNVVWGDIVTISGNYFAIDPDHNSVIFGGSYSCTNVTNVVPGQIITCTAPEYSYISYLRITKYGLNTYNFASSNNFYFYTSTTSYYSTGGRSSGNDTSPGAVFVYIIIGVVFCIFFVCTVVYCIKSSADRQRRERERLLPRPNPNQNQQRPPQNFGSIQGQPNPNAPGSSSVPPPPPQPRPIVDNPHNPDDGELVLCDICNENDKNTAMNCGHMTCYACNTQLTTCPFCKVAITSRQRVYLR